MLIGLFGGTFNPIHLAHLIIAEYVRDSLLLDQLIFMPCAKPPHKSDHDLADGVDRLHMIQLAIEGNSHFYVSNLELIRGGKSYTVDTVQALSDLYRLNQSDFFLIIGADNFQDIHSWRTPDIILKLCSLVVVKRPKSTIPKFPAFAQDIITVDIPLLEISSSEIRQRVRQDQSVRYLVPHLVEEYIFSHKLYRT